MSSFLVGLLAARELSPSSLGAYALCYSAFLLASVIPVCLVFTPIEIRMLHLDGTRRTRVFSKSLLIGPVVTTGAGILVCGATILIPSSAPWSARLTLAATSAVLAATSPLQDHVRRVMHAAQRSWSAAVMSAVLVIATVWFIALGLAFALPVYWIPFLALALGNVVSIVVALTMLGVNSDRKPHGLDLSARSIAAAGRWLLVGTGWGFACGFAAVAIVTAVAGANAAGYAEAARVISQPVTVLSIGLLSVLNPVITTAAVRRDIAAMWRNLRRFFILIASGALAWVTVTAVHWPGNPLFGFFPNAYRVRGLLPLLTIEQALGYAALAYQGALMAQGRQRYQAGVDVISGALGLMTVAATAYTGSYAIAFGGLVGAIALHIGGYLGLGRRRLAQRNSRSPDLPRRTGIDTSPVRQAHSMD